MSNTNLSQAISFLKYVLSTSLPVTYPDNLKQLLDQGNGGMAFQACLALFIGCILILLFVSDSFSGPRRAVKALFFPSPQVVEEPYKGML